MNNLIKVLNTKSDYNITDLRPKNQELLKKLVDIYNKASKQLIKFNKYYNKISHLFNNSYNLKLYDLNNYLYDNIEKMGLTGDQASDLFYDFCDYSYNCMIDDLAVNRDFFYKTVKYIGNSSSFYIFNIDKLHDFIDCDFNEMIIYRKIIESINRLEYSDFYSLNDLLAIVDDILGKNDTFIYDDKDIERLILEYIDDLNYIIEFFFILSFKRFYDN